MAEIRKVRTERDHAVAESNEIVADLFSGKCVYAKDIEKIMFDRSAIARTKLLRLPQLLARVVLGATGEQRISHLTEAVEQIAAELKPFDAADFCGEGSPGPWRRRSERGSGRRSNRNTKKLPTGTPLE